MQVVAIAGHVGHGKSALVRAITGIDPGGAGELSSAWTTLPSGARLAFVDAPGHERAVDAMLAGLGQASAVMVVVAADEGWMPQSAEHVAAADALGVRHGLLVVSRADLTDPKLATRQARTEIERTTLGGAEAVAVSTRTGQGIEDLRAALDRLVARLPVPDPEEPVRLWIDGVPRTTESGIEVAGTLSTGTVRVGDALTLGTGTTRTVRVGDIRAPVDRAEEVSGVGRVVLSLPGAGHGIGCGTPLVSPDRWTFTTSVDVRLSVSAASGRLARHLTLHIGSAAVPVRLRPLGPDTARLTLNTALPLHVGDRALLRDPPRRAVAGASVLDVRPPPLTRPGAAGMRAREMASWPDRPEGHHLLRRHGVLRTADLDAMGCAPPDGGLRVGSAWVADPEYWESLRRWLVHELARHAAANPKAPGIPLETARLRLGLPERSLVEELIQPPLRLHRGRVYGAPLGEAL
jgi:selenocysteine-specific elongation factor